MKIFPITNLRSAPKIIGNNTPFSSLKIFQIQKNGQIILQNHCNFSKSQKSAKFNRKEFKSGCHENQLRKLGEILMIKL